MTYKELPKDARQGELDLIDRWEKMDLLDRSIKEREGKPNYVFYDGPPTANGKPGVHHVIARTLKDMTCRYKTMQGYRVRRKAGWDTHGLPVEIEVEKKLGFHDKQDIEAYGVEKFNEKCRESVFEYRDLWMDMSHRMAFLADMDNPYITLDNDYVETVWHLLDDFYRKGLIYKGAKILPYCSRCGTGLASHEVAQGYEEDDVMTVYPMFPIKGKEKEYFLAWTTTPWTLLSNVALTVHPDADYVKVKQGDVKLILAKALMGQALRDQYGEIEVLETMKGKDLEYMEYDQLLPFVDVKGKAFFVTCADYVTMEDGTGVVHTAPAFGEDDYQTGRRYDLALVNPVGDDGTFLEGPYKGTFVMDADPQVIQYLRDNGLCYGTQKITHNYPHCWRCHTPLIYYAKPSWYIDVSSHAQEMVEANKKVNWFPDHVGEKRFGNWLENLKDWAISRTRYWGTPLNLWVCPDCGHVHSVGSRKQLAEEAIEEIDESIDLHRPYVDNVHIKCPECGGTMSREPDVIDVWFDSGAMPFAQLHYPFEHKDDLEKEFFPADFISEGIDQTRGWFYSLMAISILYKGLAPYKNVLVNDLVLDKNGAKMSKSKGNTLDPFDLFDKYSADAIRFYSLFVSPPWVPTRFDVEGVKEVNAKFFRTLKNVYQMFALYANTNGWEAASFSVPVEERPEIDRWLLSRFQSLYKTYREEMEIFEYTKVVHALSDFVVEDLSNWYIRRNRSRFWSSEDSDYVKSCFLTTYEVVLGLSKLIAPITPFLADQVYLALTHGEAMDSVHLEYLPEAHEEIIDKALEEKMDLVRKIVNLGRASREDAQIKVRQPLQEIMVDKKYRDQIADLVDLIKEELNVKEVVFSDALADYANIALKPNYKLAGSILGGKIKEFARKLKEVDAHQFLEKIQDGLVTMELGGEEVSIPKDYVLADFHAKEGYDVAMDGNVSVVLETELNPNLIREGFAREFISRIQQARKKKDFDVADRIEIVYDGDETLVDAIRENQEMIAGNVLALALTYEKGTKGEEEDLNGHTIHFTLKKVDD
ncbi:isoleucine--tRNA ligase [Kallipyga gabonensis]|uniref:isoleucine--tRNA ligase n=1 Tax=Kallipyga gabonensis TaxID=1686287 RepID=UPI0006B44D80|nr:isoleucine--tRNA ligase [Kallipyga gabonensis]